MIRGITIIVFLGIVFKPTYQTSKEHYNFQALPYRGREEDLAYLKGTNGNLSAQQAPGTGIPINNQNEAFMPNQVDKSGDLENKNQYNPLQNNTVDGVQNQPINNVNMPNQLMNNVNMPNQPNNNDTNGLQYQPNNNGLQYQPNNNGMQYQPNLNGMQYQPNTNGLQYQPNTNGSQYQPNTNGSQYQPNNNGMHQQIPKVEASKIDNGRTTTLTRENERITMTKPLSGTVSENQNYLKEQIIIPDVSEVIKVEKNERKEKAKEKNHDEETKEKNDHKRTLIIDFSENYDHHLPIVANKGNISVCEEQHCHGRRLLIGTVVTIATIVIGGVITRNVVAAYADRFITKEQSAMRKKSRYSNVTTILRNLSGYRLSQKNNYIDTSLTPNLAATLGITASELFANPDSYDRKRKEYGKGLAKNRFVNGEPADVSKTMEELFGSDNKVTDAIKSNISIGTIAFYAAYAEMYEKLEPYNRRIHKNCGSCYAELNKNVEKKFRTLLDYREAGNIRTIINLPETALLIRAAYRGLDYLLNDKIIAMSCSSSQRGRSIDMTKICETCKSKWET